MTDPGSKMSRHELLTEVHLLVAPEMYLETGVQYGHSLALARAARCAIGIDPEPLIVQSGNQVIYKATADDYFTYVAEPEMRIDLAFIDGSHMFEDALRDFINIEGHSHSGTVVIFDDVLPYSSSVGGRTMVPGHWAGDVWKIKPIFDWVRSNSGLRYQLIDTEPTGTMLVWGLDRSNRDLAMAYDTIRRDFLDRHWVPEDVIKRTQAVAPGVALGMLRSWIQERVTA